MENARHDYISWDEMFMRIAETAAMRSKDPNTQVGACIVSADNIILGIGYNGLPRGCSDRDFPWSKDGDSYDTKYMYVVHAEANAILNKNCVNLNGSTIYVTLYPCNECAKLIIQSGITTVIYRHNKYPTSDSTRAATRLFSSAGVTMQAMK